MPDFVLVDGDVVNFHPAFDGAFVSVKPGRITASGPYNKYYASDVLAKNERGDEPLKAGVDGKKVCVEGDEGTVVVAGCPYVTQRFTIPGVGTLRISSLSPDGIAQQERLGGKKVLLKGSNFQAVFEVITPAKMPAPASAGPVADDMPRYRGYGSFVNSNTKQKAT